MPDISALNCEEIKGDVSVANTFYFGLDSIIPNLKEIDTKEEQEEAMQSWDDLLKKVKELNGLIDMDKQITLGDMESFIAEYIKFNETLKGNIRNYHSDSESQNKRRLIKEYEQNIEELRKFIRKRA